MTNTTAPNAPVSKSRWPLFIKISAAIAFIILFRRFILRTFVGIAIVAFGSYALVAYKNPAPTPEQLQAAQEKQEKQQAADLQKCGPPRPEWQEAELRQLTICEAALKPVEGVGGVGCWGREESRVCSLHTALAAARERREESERFARADQIRHDWIVAHPGAQQTLPMPEPDRKLSPVKPLPTSIKPAPTPVLVPTPTPVSITSPAPLSPPVDLHDFQAYVEPVNSNYAALSPDKKRLVDQTVSDFLRAYRTGGLNGVNRIIVACYDRIYRLKTVTSIEYCGSLDLAALAVARRVGNAPDFNSEEAVDRRIEDRKRVVVLPDEKNAEWENIAFATIALVTKGLAR